MQGGLENRFIPELSTETKRSIQGFFRITQDEQLKALAEQEASDVILTEDDIILDRIVSPGAEVDPSHLSIDGVNYMEQTINVLQAVACQRRGELLMRVGGDDGMRLARAAFAVIIKFSEQVGIFTTVWNAVEEASFSVSPDQQIREDGEGEDHHRYDQII